MWTHVSVKVRSGKVSLLLKKPQSEHKVSNLNEIFRFRSGVKNSATRQTTSVTKK